MWDIGDKHSLCGYSLCSEKYVSDFFDQNSEACVSDTLEGTAVDISTLLVTVTASVTPLCQTPSSSKQIPGGSIGTGPLTDACQ